MVWLLSLPLWVIIWNFFHSGKSQRKISARLYIFICALGVIFVMGLRSKHTGSMDTYLYAKAFLVAEEYSNLFDYWNFREVFDGLFLFSEAGFHSYIWLASKILPGTQWFILLTSAIIVAFTAKFISDNSDDPLISWITFICLGSMTFAMNGMRQTLAMSICLLAYRYVREKKLFRFLFLILIAVLFHKSAMVFAVVYLLRNMKMNVKYFSIITALVGLFLVFVNRLAFLYDSMTGEDYAINESFDSGGVVVILIYLVAIVTMLIRYKRLKSPENFLPFALIVIGLALYIGRFVSVQIYERISYYFAYFLMLGFPIVLKDPNPKVRLILRVSFVVIAILLFVYRINKGVFTNFEMCW